jgi:hypothetical protein
MNSAEINSTVPTDEPSKQSSANHVAPANDKVLLLAVGLVDGKLVITPRDLEFETDDQNPLSKTEQNLLKKSQATFDQHRHGFEQALQALLIIFAGRLHREKFSGFEQYCFALHGLSLSQKKLAELKAKASKLSLTPGRK